MNAATTSPISVSPFSTPFYADFYGKQGSSFTVCNQGASYLICKVQTTLPEQYSIFPGYFTLGPQDSAEVLLLLELTPAIRGMEHAFRLQAMAITRRERGALLDPGAVGESVRMYRRFWEDHYPGARVRGQVFETTVRPELRPGVPSSSAGAGTGMMNSLGEGAGLAVRPLPQPQVGLLRSMRATSSESNANLSRQRAELRQELARLEASTQTLEQTTARDRMLCARTAAEADRVERELRTAERLRGNYLRLRIYKYEFSAVHVAMAAMGGLLAGLLLQLKAKVR